MPRWLKVVLIVLAVVVLLCGLSSAGAYGWFNENKERLKGVGERAKKEGATFASQHSAEECVDEGLRRLSEHSGIVDQAENKLFLKECLQRATRPAGFCDDVPAGGQIIQSATWAVHRCFAKGKTDDQNCARMMQVLQEICASTPPLPAG